MKRMEYPIDDFEKQRKKFITNVLIKLGLIFCLGIYVGILIGKGRI